MKPQEKNNVTVKGNLESPDTMIFAHGFGTDQTSWDEVAKAFEDQYRIVLFDNVGGGRSPESAFSPHKYETLDSYAEDLIDICESLGLKDAILVAHSVSGMISLLASIKKPEYFRKLIVVGASPRYRNEPGYKGGFEQEDLDGLYATMDNNYFAWASGFSKLAMGNPDRPSLAENFANSLAEIRPDIAQSVARTIFQSDYRSELPKVNRPVLIVQAREDIAVPLDVAEYLHKNIKNSDLVMVDATGHFPHISAPKEVIRVINQFIHS